MSPDLKNDIPQHPATAAVNAMVTPVLQNPIIVELVESAEWRAQRLLSPDAAKK